MTNIHAHCNIFVLLDKDKDGQETNEKEDSKKDKKKESGDKKKEKEDKKKKEKEEKKKKEAEKKKEKPKEPKVNQIKEALQFETNMVDSFGLSKEQYNSSKEKLNKLDEIDRIKQERETSLNDLESFILNIREKLYEDIYEKSSTEEEREKITEKVIYELNNPKFFKGQCYSAFRRSCLIFLPLLFSVQNFPIGLMKKLALSPKLIF